MEPVGIGVMVLLAVAAAMGVALLGWVVHCLMYDAAVDAVTSVLCHDLHCVERAVRNIGDNVRDIKSAVSVYDYHFTVFEMVNDDPKDALLIDHLEANFIPAEGEKLFLSGGGAHRVVSVIDNGSIKCGDVLVGDLNLFVEEIG